MPLGMAVVADPGFKRTVQRFRDASPLIVATNLSTLVRGAANAAKIEARLHLKDLVYTAPLPPSAYRLWPSAPEKYLAMDSGGYAGRRTGRVWKATKTRGYGPAGNTYMADMFVDQSDFARYYYAWVLNFGGYQTRNGYYPPKPFFTITVKVMRARFHGIGLITLGSMKANLLGWSTPAVEAAAMDVEA